VAPLAFLLALLGAVPAPVAARPRPIEIDGNMVLVDEVYLAAIDLPDRIEPTPQTALAIESQILSFLRRAGYALATVDASAAGGRIQVTIDEGRLSRIAVSGRDVVATLAVRLQIDLPYDVFNRPQLERVLDRHRADGLRVTYELVPSREVNHSGPQVNPLALMPGSQPLPPESQYELHIEFTGMGERGGFTLVAGIDPDSIRAGGSLSGGSALFDGDRWEVEAQVGANFFEDLRRQADELHFSRAFLDARWLAPGIVFPALRPLLRVREDLLRRQRQDLLVETYWWNRLEGSAGLAFVPRDGIEVSAELGAQQRDLFAVRQLAEAPEPVEPSSTLRWFASLSGRLVLQPDRLRLDRRERIELEARYFPGLNHSPFWYGEAQYRRVFEFGWNDLWLRVAAGGVAGKYDIADPMPMSGRYLRGVYGHQFYLDRAAAVALEYRISLTRDVFKAGFFHEAAVLREADRPDIDGDPLAANSFGPSFHALVMDVLQLDFYYAAGFTTEGDFDHGVSLRAEKAF